MITFSCAGETIQGSRAERGKDFIFVYDMDGALSHHFGEITDFSVFALESGEWSAPAPTDGDRVAALERAILEMAGEIYG